MKKQALRDSFMILLRGVTLAAFIGMAQSAQAASPAPKPNFDPVLEADKLSYDENTKTVTALGHVEIGTPNRILRADKVTYNKDTDVVIASGNVVIKEESGEILYSNEVEVTSDMREGFIERAGILFPDNSRLITRDASRYQGRYLIANYGVYTACNLCKEDPKKAPVWQVKGKRITHDSEKKDVIYRDATIEFSGVPVFYTPYFSHPDPSVKRRQGFLSPTAGMNKTLGAFVRTPYYFDNAPNDDLLLTPMFSAQDKVQMLAVWRHRFANGEMNWNASAAHAQLVNENGYDRGEQLRGHIIGDTQFALTNKWKAGTNIAYVSDKSYMLRYGLPADEVLINKGYLNYYSGRNHGSGTVYYFLDQRPNNALVEPLVAPELRYSAFGEPNKTMGGRWSFDSSLLITKRRRDIELTRQGANTRRLSVDGGWERQFISGTGFLTTLSGNIRADSYWADNVPDPNQPLGTGFSNVARVRPFTQANLLMRYPLGRHGDGYQQIVEPLALLTVAPRSSRNLVLPNEDSLDVEFDETNLFLPSRFTGVDRVEGGTRIAYGMRHSLISDNGARIDFIGGQIYQFKPDDNFGPGSGLNDNFSDYVARTQFIPGSWMDLSYGVRLDKDDFDFTKQDVTGSIGHAYFRPNARYLFLKQTNTTTLEKEFLEEITYGFTSQFAKYWTLSASHTRAMQPEPGPRDISVSLLYKDECLTTGVTASRTYTSRLDVEPGSTILFNLYLKNIGGFTTD